MSKFKVGDRVRVVSKGHTLASVGDEGVIDRIDGDGLLWVDFVLAKARISPGFVELCEAAPAGQSETEPHETPVPEFTLDWPYGHQLRDGRKARIVCSDLKGTFPLALAVAKEDGTEGLTTRCTDGRLFEDGPCSSDVINAPAPKREWWVNVYAEFTSAHYSRTAADLHAAPNRLACVYVTEGDGLDEG